MATPTLFLPVENQVRELDARLLLARLAAARGYRSIVGWKPSVDAHVNEFRPGVYFAKSELVKRCEKIGLLAGLEGSVKIDQVHPDIFSITPA